MIVFLVVLALFILNLILIGTLPREGLLPWVDDVLAFNAFGLGSGLIGICVYLFAESLMREWKKIQDEPPKK